MQALFEGIEVKPATLHGDLWSGNMASVDGKPAVFDPAVYYGHDEAEFGMSWCAGFGSSFWDAYFQENPKQPGFDKRKDLYLCYHYLNHYNLLVRPAMPCCCWLAYAMACLHGISNCLEAGDIACYRAV